MKDRTAALLTGLAAGFGALFSWRPLDSLDLWWHLDMGRAVLENGARRYEDPAGIPQGVEYVNPEWVFDVLVYWVHGAGGLDLVQGLVAVLAGLSAGACFLLAREASGRDSTGLLVTAMVIGATSWRFAPRPQSLFLALLPLVLLAAWVGARAASRRGPALALLLLSAVWSQSHSSMVIAPFVALMVGLHVPEARRDRVWLTALGLGFVVPLLGPFGVEVVGQIVAHSGTDSARHITDMRPMPADAWWPRPGNSVFFAEGLLVLGAVGSWRARRINPWLFGLVVLGFAMTLTAHRFRAAWSILMLPWVADSWREGIRHRVVGYAGAAAALALLLAREGLPEGGWVRASVPIGGAQALRALDLRGPIFNDYDDGGWLGWTLHGRNRVFIDGRTPTHFDDERFFAARAALGDPWLFGRLNRVHHFTAALVPRSSSLCVALADGADGWSPVWTGQSRTLFVPSTDHRPLRFVPACGAVGHLAACRASADPAGFLDEVDRLAGLAPGEDYLWRLSVVIALDCASDLERASTSIERARAANPDHADLGWLQGRIAWARGDVEGALEAVSEDESPRGAELRIALFEARGDTEGVLREGADLLEVLGDDAPPVLRCQVAVAAEAEGEFDLSVTQSFRGHLQGAEECRDTLERHAARGRLTGEQRRLLGL